MILRKDLLMATANTAKKEATIVDARHPLYVQESALWTKWRLCYEGSDSFREAYLYPYSKREDIDDFSNRKKITYIPGHARAVINIIRNGLAVRLPDVVRRGSGEYEQAMATDVDGFKSSMTTFVALDITPLLLVQGKRFVIVDAPPTKEGSTKAEDLGAPYIYTVDAEDVLSWSYREDENGFKAILIRLSKDVEDPNTGLVVETQTIYRFMRYLEHGEAFSGECGMDFTGPGVLIQTLDEEGKLLKDDNGNQCQFFEIDHIPVVEFSLVASIMAEIADHQIALLNLASTDMDFVWRGNFPLYTEMQPKKTGSIRPRGTKRRKADENADVEDPLAGADPGTGRNSTQRRTGIGKGIGYAEGMDRPGFIAPETQNLTVSMQKQESIAKEIRILVDLALVSLSVRAVEQSGKSKEADRIGEEAGLAYIGQALETGEREVAKYWHMMSGEEGVEIEVKYPESYSIATPSERREAASQLRTLHSTVRSATFQQIIDKRIAEILLKGITDPDQIAAVLKEIEEGAFLDDDKERAAVIQKDVVVKILSRGTAAELRGYGDDEAEKVRADASADVSAMLGGREGAPSAGDGASSGGDGGDED